MISHHKRVHEKFHEKTKQQYKIIKESNFTYHIIISTLTPHLKAGMRILDIGCGAGTIDIYLASKGFNITGVDISKKAISECRKTANNLHLKNVDFNVLDFPNESIKGKFNFIIFTEVIEHIENDTKALKLISKALKPGGILYLSTPSKNAPLFRMGLADDFDRSVGHLRRYSNKEISTLIKSSNFRIMKIYEKEGIIRNILFVNSYCGKSIRFIVGPISKLVSALDSASVKIFGESDLIIICKKKQMRSVN